ncbi:DUF523 domain-containing protein [Mariprofundus sp. EBB-1]|uniref:DUF523 domain-containing protein n=1 Tax=Mariprofundus sp. EBB-1 TaxID=2650971 RepID=UPI000EF2158C|nr:DUF523 domain-containing protein [Mariprofundus sp. EBB-1]RLL54064.1 DUF523 domain-containing protein [Mariprofundus sp. EBB-1]
MHKILISACLLGERVRYDGKHSSIHSDVLQAWEQQGRLIPLCPEVAGGLPIPRPPAEIEAGDAKAVIKGEGAIRRKDGSDVTEAFMAGAEMALALCMQHDIRIAILKEGSPSCGVNRLNDGSFSGIKISGQGVTACLLAQHGISVFSEFQTEEAETRLDQLTRYHFGE